MQAPVQSDWVTILLNVLNGQARYSIGDLVQEPDGIVTAHEMVVRQLGRLGRS